MVCKRALQYEQKNHSTQNNKRRRQENQNYALMVTAETEVISLSTPNHLIEAY